MPLAGSLARLCLHPEMPRGLGTHPASYPFIFKPAGYLFFFEHDMIHYYFILSFSL
jgi:hypothetical protein